MTCLVWFKVLKYWFIWFLWKIPIETHYDGGRGYVIISTDVVLQNWVPLSRRLRWWRLTGIFQVWWHFCSWGLGAAYPPHCRYPKPWPMRGSSVKPHLCTALNTLDWSPAVGDNENNEKKNRLPFLWCHYFSADKSTSDRFRSVHSIPYSVKPFLSFLFTKIWWEHRLRIYRVK